MKIIFIGAGNLAVNLAKELYSKGFKIAQVYSRTQESAEALAQQVDARAITDLHLVEPDADLYIFAVKDAVLEDLLATMPATSGVWAHTAGSVSLSVFQNYHRNFGVIYPFQTFSKNRQVNFREIPLLLEASNAESFTVLSNLSEKISDSVISLSSEKRKYIHLCGVFACNFVNHLYAVSETILASQNIPFDILLPLIDETARKVHELSPREAQTGPAVRYDQNVIERHLSLLEGTDFKAIYDLLSKNIHEINLKKNKNEFDQL